MHGRTLLLGFLVMLGCLLPATAQAATMPPGVYDVTLTEGTLDVGSLLPPFTLDSGTTFPATIGTDPVSQPIGLTVPDIPIASPAGTISVTTDGAGVTIVPATGSATVDATFDVSITVNSVGTCSLSGVSVHLTTDNGSAWDPATNAFSMVDNTFALPTLDCGSNALLAGLVTTLLGSTGAGNNVITLLGTAIRRPDLPPTTTTNNTTNTTNTSSQSPTTGGAGTAEQPATTPATTAPGAKRCVVPKLVGKTLKQAKRRLKKAGCKAGKAKSKRSKKKKGRVIKQRYKAGKKLPLGTKVSLTVSKGPSRKTARTRG